MEGLVRGAYINPFQIRETLLKAEADEADVFKPIWMTCKEQGLEIKSQKQPQTTTVNTCQDRIL